MINRYLHLSETQIYVAFIVGVFIGKIFAVLTYCADYALFPAVYNIMFCPPHCWTFPTSIPYSIAWYYLNLFFLFPDTFAGRFYYGVYILLFDALTTIGYWQIKRIPKFYLAMLQVLSIMFYLGQGSEYQNVTIIAFLPLAFFSAWFLAVPILLKLPLGWALPWDFSNPHVQCVLQCTGWTAHHTIFNIIFNGITNYGILVFAWYWTWDTIRKRKKV